MPALSVHHNAKRVWEGWVLLKTTGDGIEEATFFLLALGVQLIELGRDLAGACGILRAEEFDDIGSNVHATGGIDSGSDAKSDFAGSKRTPAYLRGFEQRFEPGIDSRTQ